MMNKRWNKRNTEELKIVLEPLYKRQMADSEVCEAAFNLSGFLKTLVEIERDVRRSEERGMKL